MNRVAVIHWNAAEAAEHLRQLEAAGCQAELIQPAGGKDLETLARNPPQAIIIDLSRLPSQGRELAGWLRRRKDTRYIPLVFAGGQPEKVETTRRLLPDAVFAQWPAIRAALRQAVEKAPSNPVVPGTMDAYSGRALPKKLGIRVGSKVVLLGAPPGFEQKLKPLPENVEVRTRANAGGADVLLLFNNSLRELQKRFSAATKLLPDRGCAWLVWPKKASGIQTDLSEQVVRAFGLAAGWVDYKVCALDETWSGLAFVRRRARNPGPAR